MNGWPSDQLLDLSTDRVPTYAPERDHERERAVFDDTADTIDGHAGALHVEVWRNPDARYLAVLCHGYGEHIGRYTHVAARLVRHGAAVYGLDHAGHGRSEGERVLIQDIDAVVDDLHRLVEFARGEHLDLPVVLIGHSLGGLLAARYAQRHAPGLLDALTLSAPVLGRWDAANQLLALEVVPEAPIDPAALSRDPAVGEAYEQDPLVWHGSFKRPTLEALVHGLETVSKDGEVVDLPVLWLHGDADEVVPIEPTREGVRALVPSDRLTPIVYPGARHEVFNETNRDEVLDDVTSFIDRVLV